MTRFRRLVFVGIESALMVRWGRGQFVIVGEMIVAGPPLNQIIRR